MEYNHSKKEKRPGKRVVRTIIVIAIIIIIILLLLRACSSGSLGDTLADTPFGNFEVGGKRDNKAEEETDGVEYITFSGFGKYEVSAEYPNVELSNPEGNICDMIFTLSDKETGDVIARTGKVAAGDYVYVNVVDYYTQPGTYIVTVNIESYGEDGNPMNGLDQEMEVTVK